MEDSMDVDTSPLSPQNYLFSCELKANKGDHFKVDNDENEHQLSLRTVSLGAGAKDELHIVEAEAMNYEGSPIKVTLATLKMSVEPTVSLGGFEITLPVLLWLKCGSGPVHIITVEEDAESEDEEEEDVKLLSISGKWLAPGSGSKVPQKKVILAADEDEDDDDDDDDDDDFDEEGTEEKKSIRDTPAKNAHKSNQNGKDSKPSSTPRAKGQESFKKQEKTPKTPKGPSSVEDIKAKMQAMEARFISYVKNCFWMTDQEQWRKSL
uniref:Nucleophosmin n=1 Tax=Rhinopithecus roxellana TaxID=61622 RepID=A0A2K6RXJ7_RHIRO